jgi:putative oxidoreductase
MNAIPLIGRILFSLIFVMSGLNHFSAQTIGYASSQGVPMANILVPISGVLAILGGLSIILGLKTRIGAVLIVLFLVPVTFMMHNFWTKTDPMARQMDMIQFMKNISMLGGALILMYWGGGPLSVSTCPPPAQK